MTADKERKGYTASRKALVFASAILLVWNLIGIDLTSFQNGLLGFLAAIPRGVVPVALTFVIFYLTFAMFRDLPPKSELGFMQWLDLGVNCLLAASAVVSYFSRLTGSQLISAIQQSPTCLVFSAFGWAVAIPPAFALFSSQKGVVKTEGLTILGPALLGCGMLAVWLSVSIASNLWPAWVGAWIGLVPGVLLVQGWRRR